MQLRRRMRRRASSKQPQLRSNVMRRVTNHVLGGLLLHAVAVTGQPAVGAGQQARGV